MIKELFVIVFCLHLHEFLCTRYEIKDVNYSVRIVSNVCDYDCGWVYEHSCGLLSIQNIFITLIY